MTSRIIVADTRTSISQQQVTRPTRADLTSLPHWVVFEFEPQPGGKKPRKVPYIPGTRIKADVSNPETWRTHAEAVRDGRVRGVAITPAMGLTVIDEDGVSDLDGTITPATLERARRLDSRTERSISRTGVHIFVHGRPPEHFVAPPGVEVYPRTGNRFLIITDDLIDGVGRAAIEDRTDVLAALFPPRQAPARPIAPAPELDLDNEEVIRRVLIMPTGRRLHGGGDMSGYPSGSEADLGLLNCYVAAGATDPDRLDVLFRDSALYPVRQKRWNDARYREKTIAKALDGYVVPFDGWNRPNTGVVVGNPHDAGRPFDAESEPLAASSGDPCAPVRDELAELRRENATLRRENTELRQGAEAANHYRSLWEATARVLRNPNLRPGEKMVGLSLIVEVEAAVRTGRTDADGWVEVPLERMSERAGCAAGTAGKHVDTVARAGVIETDTRPIPGKRHARRVVRFPTAPATDGPAPKLADRIATLANAAPERTDDGWGGDRRCRDHPHAGTVTTTTTIVACAECGQIIGTPITRRRQSRPIVTQDEGLSDAESSAPHDPIVNEKVRPPITTVLSAPRVAIVAQDARLSARPSDQPDPWADPGAIVDQDAALSSRPIVTQDDGLSPPPRPGGILDHARTPRPRARP